MVVTFGKLCRQLGAKPYEGTTKTTTKEAKMHQARQKGYALQPDTVHSNFCPTIASVNSSVTPPKVKTGRRDSNVITLIKAVNCSLQVSGS